MLIETFKSIFIRDILKLKNEIELYNNEDKIWRIEKAITNSAGNLCLHLIGNLNAHIGGVLGQSGYTRDRALEFSAKNVPRQDLLAMIDETSTMLENTFEHLKDAELEKDYPILVFDHQTTIAFMLVHLAGHLNYHLGQINYHRRLIDCV